MEEIWKDIKGYEGLYMISSYGRVKSLDHYEKCGNFKRFRKGRIRKSHINKYGYTVITLCKDGKITPPKKISRLEAIAFDLPIPEHLKDIPIEQLEVDHIDTNKSNDILNNLRWTDHYGNMQKPITKEHISEAQKGKKMPPRTEEWRRKIGEGNKNNSKISKVVLQIDRYTNEIINEFPSIMEVKRQLDFAHSDISACCLGKRKTAYGYKWSFK